MRFGWARAVALTGFLVLAACGGAPAPDAGSSEAIAEAEAFMAKNAGAPGVVTLPSGLQYKVVAAAPAGAPGPDSNDLVRVDYEGALVDGEVFDSSFAAGRPYVTTPEQVVPGWTEALQAMKVGDEWMVYVPPALGYGEQVSAKIPAHSVLVFRIKLLDVAAVPGGNRGVGLANG